MRYVTVQMALELGVFTRSTLRKRANTLRKRFNVGYLLGSSTKIEASNAADTSYISYIQYLSPDTEYTQATGIVAPSLCPFATPACSAVCLGKTSGRMRFTANKRARINRTALYHSGLEDYFTVLVDEVLRVKDKAQRDGLKLALRLNGTSDILWERLTVDIFGFRFGNIFDCFPDIVFYDYTKVPVKHRLDAVDTDSYKLTYSYSERSDSIERAREYSDNGAGVAIVYTGNPLQALDSIGLDRENVVNGDEHDMRFLDPPNAKVLLKAKGAAVRDRSGFVVHA